MKKAPWILLAAVLFSGCATTQLTVSRTRPAEVDMSRYHTIAMNQIVGENGDEFTDDLAQAIFNSGHFTVVNGGKADAILTGQINKRWYNQTNNSAQGVCYEAKQSYDCFSNTTTGTWNTSVGLRLVDSRTNRVITTKSLKADDVKNVALNTVDGSQYPDPNWDVETVFSGLEHQMIGDFMHAIAPYNVPVRVQLFTDSHFPQLERGATFAKNGDWGNAISSFKEAAEQADASADTKPELKARCHYNYGIALGYSGQDFAGADREIALAISIQPNQVYYQERTKIESFKHDDEVLKKGEAPAKKGTSHKK